MIPMNEPVPIRKLIKVSLITTPFLGITAATPEFLAPVFSVNRLLIGFFSIMLFATIIWVVNIFLLYQAQRWKTLQVIWVRFVLSTLVTCVMAVIAFNLFRAFHPMPAMGYPRFVPIDRIQKLPPPRGKPFFFPLFQSLSMGVIIFILIELVLLREWRNRVALENEQLKTANLESRINSLREQMHPHFLFNSLSTLRSLISRSPQKAEIYLEQLAELLRFSTDNSRAIISLKDEVTLCVNYLNMQKVRFGEALEFGVNLPEDKMNNIHVPVYSLQQLAENAIKHNTLTKESPLNITIFYNGITNEIITSNNLQPKPGMANPSGTGLKNLSERYKLLGYHGIEIKKTETKFSVAIRLLKNESSNH